MYTTEQLIAAVKQAKEVSSINEYITISSDVLASLLGILEERKAEEVSDEEACDIYKESYGYDSYDTTEIFMQGCRHKESQLLPTISTLKAENESLKNWKEEAISVMPDYQAIGKAIGVPLGQSVHDKILPAIENLKEENLKFFGNILHTIPPTVRQEHEEAKAENEKKDALLAEAFALIADLVDDSRDLEAENKWRDGTTKSNERYMTAVRNNIARADAALTHYNNIIKTHTDESQS